jgi:hypothetical protein
MIADSRAPVARRPWPFYAAVAPDANGVALSLARIATPSDWQPPSPANDADTVTVRVMPQRHEAKRPDAADRGVLT